MHTTPTGDDHATKLGTLVNPDRIRSSIKRLFRNRIDELLSELFQNSQRSRATTVDIVTTENTFTIHDNGHGLLNGIDGFHTLLTLAESNFDNDTIEDQDPMEADERTVAEIVGYRNALSYIQQLAEDPDFRLDESLLRSLHFMMLGHDTSKSPGRYRKNTIYVVDEEADKVVYEGPKFEMVPGLMT